MGALQISFILLLSPLSFDGLTGAGQPLIGNFSSEFKTYPVPAGKAEEVARSLQGILKGHATIRVSAVGGKSLLVYANPEQQLWISGLLDHGPKKNEQAPQGRPAAQQPKPAAGELQVRVFWLVSGPAGKEGPSLSEELK